MLFDVMESQESSPPRDLQGTVNGMKQARLGPSCRGQPILVPHPLTFNRTSAFNILAQTVPLHPTFIVS